MTEHICAHPDIPEQHVFVRAELIIYKRTNPREPKKVVPLDWEFDNSDLTGSNAYLRELLRQHAPGVPPFSYLAYYDDGCVRDFVTDLE